MTARQKVQVIYMVNGSVCTDEFTCSRASTQIHPGKDGVVKLVEGRDDVGPVRSAQYGDVARILVRPE